MLILDDPEQYLLLTPYKFNQVADFRFTRGYNRDDYSMTSIYMEMRTSNMDARDSLKLYFDDCRDIQMLNVGTMSGICLQTIPFRSEFFEKARFQIQDIENEQIKFLCASFSAESIG
ncbi:hypothetical protein FHX05_005409 [Rhizobium sp. BK491]|nr:hypothetical protein [Rhizobium sp. BK491]